MHLKKVAILKRVARDLQSISDEINCHKPLNSTHKPEFPSEGGTCLDTAFEAKVLLSLEFGD